MRYDENASKNTAISNKVKAKHLSHYCLYVYVRRNVFNITVIFIT